MSTNIKNSNGYVNKSMNALKKSNKWVKGLVGVFIVLLVALIIYWIYKAYKTASQGDAENPILVADTIDASDSGNSKSWDLPESSSANSPNMAFTLSFWIKEAGGERFGLALSVACIPWILLREKSTELVILVINKAPTSKESTQSTRLHQKYSGWDPITVSTSWICRGKTSPQSGQIPGIQIR